MSSYIFESEPECQYACRVCYGRIDDAIGQIREVIRRHANDRDIFQRGEEERDGVAVYHGRYKGEEVVWWQRICEDECERDDCDASVCTRVRIGTIPHAGVQERVILVRGWVNRGRTNCFDFSPREE